MEAMTWGVGEGWYRKQSIICGEDGFDGEGGHVFQASMKTGVQILSIYVRANWMWCLPVISALGEGFSMTNQTSGVCELLVEGETLPP